MWKRVAFDEYRPPESPALIGALLSELSDEEAELLVLPWVLLVVGSMASLAANVAVAEPSVSALA